MPAQVRLPALRPSGTNSLDARKEIDVIGDCRHSSVRDADVNPANLILSHQRHRVGAQDAHAIERAAVHQHADQREIIRRARIDATNGKG